MILPIERGPVTQDVFYTSKAPKFLPRTTMPPMLKTYNSNGHRPPRYYLGWPLDFDDIAQRGGPKYTTAVHNAVKAWGQRYRLDSPSPVEPRCEYTRYRHGDSTYLFFVWITDNVDEKGIACAENVEYLEETAGYLGGVVNGEPIWIRSR